MFILIIENMMRIHIKIIFAFKEWKGKRYIRMQPKSEAHVPGANGI